MKNISITYYTDPLCCWSWGIDSAIQRIQNELGKKVSLRYCMGGLIPGWDNFDDPLNNVSRPFQMGPVWMHAASVTGAKIDFNLWHRDPPASSYPSCIAFKSAELQSPAFAEVYLQMMREACMLEGINISKPAELLNIADKLKARFPDFDLKKFTAQLNLSKGEALAAFKKDLEETRLKNIRRFPTLIFRSKGSNSIVATGYRPYEAFLSIIEKMLAAEDAKPAPKNANGHNGPQLNPF